jgi:phenylacetate-coenzyme A ligase PaaK-like adenylate-forming protein
VSRAVGFWLGVDAVPTLRAPRLSPDDLEALARRRLTRLLQRAAETEFYGERLRGAGIRVRKGLLERDPEGVLEALSPVGKQELRSAGPRVLSGGRIRPEWLSSSSSGSTGEPFRVYYDARAWATLKHLVKLRARRACGLRLTDRVALLDATPLNQPRPDPSRPSRVARISVLQPAAAIAAQLAGFAPDVVYGLPSALLEIAAACRARGERLPVRLLFTSGELLQPTVREELAKAFSARVFDVYGSSETKEIAWECPAGGMHLNADVVRIEILDDAGRVQPFGVEGQIVATLLVNHAMPLLRYRVGDRGSFLAESCSCGRSLPRLGVVTGRQADVLVLAGGQRVSPYSVTCALENVGDLVRYQVTQLDAARVRVRAIVGSESDRGQVADQVQTMLRAHVAPFLDAEVEFVDRLPTGPRAKFRVVQALAPESSTPSPLMLETP